MELERGERENKGEIDNVNIYEEKTYDWRGRPSHPIKHGGFRAASFVLVLQTLEIMGIAAVGNNLITYVINEMHYSLSKSANIVTNFVGTIFLLALLGGFLSDSYLGCFWTILTFAFLELSGFILLAVQAHIPELKPPKCNMVTNGEFCEEAKGFKALIFFIALYLVALGSGCVKPNMIAHGADQFTKDSPKESSKLSTYFNAAYFAFSLGQLIALSILVWVQTHSGMDAGFGLSAVVMALGILSLVCGTCFYRNKPPRGSILTPIAQVLVGAFIKRKLVFPSNVQLLNGTNSTDLGNLPHTQRFRFLDKACIKTQESRENPWKLSTINQVEQVKTLISIIPIFACTIIFNTILAQLQTFSVQQGTSMNTKLTNNFNIPPASLQAIPYIILIFLVPIYDIFLVPLARRITGHPSGFSPLNRIGLGLFTVTFSMVAAAIMEQKRRNIGVTLGVKLSIFWITPQFLIFGLSEMFTAIGLIEFFYKQDLKGMQSFLTAITYCSYSFGFFLSSLLVSLVNKITSNSLNGGWLSNNDLNKDRLDLFYWVLAVLSFINFGVYLFCAKWYAKFESNKGHQESDMIRTGEEMRYNTSSFNCAKVAEDDCVA